jgi:hypothetical protein
LDFNFCDNFLKNSISSIKTIVPIFKGLGKQTYGEQINKIIRKQIPSLRKRSFRFDIVQVESICFQIVKVPPLQTVYVNVHLSLSNSLQILL